MKKIVLFLPPYSGPALGPPAGLLCLASPLRQSGYEVKIIDAAVVPDYVDAMQREIPDALCFGISLLTGPMIRGAIAAGRRVKERRPDLPVVLGGWHPSLLPEQTLQEPFVDVVVRYQGEITFLEVVRRLERGGSLDGVAGCSFKQDGQIRNNPDRPVARIGDLPPAAYDLADFDLYEKAGGERKLPYASSVGCPYACNYCTDTVFYNRRFNAYDAQRVVRRGLGEHCPGDHRNDDVRSSHIASVRVSFIAPAGRAIAIHPCAHCACSGSLSWTSTTRGWAGRGRWRRADRARPARSCAPR